MITSKSRAGVLLIPLLLLLGACGGGPGDTAPKTAQSFLQALAEQDAEAACQLMANLEDDAGGPITEDSPDWQKCLGLMNITLSEADDVARFANAKVESADIDGNEAEVDEDNITGVVEPDISIDLTLIDGKWYVTDFD